MRSVGAQLLEIIGGARLLGGSNGGETIRWSYLSYHCPMRRAPKSFVYILLVGLFLHLGDWPYVDEIIGAPGPVSQLIGAALPSDDSGLPLQSDGAAGKSAAGYQLILSMQAIPAEPLRLPAPISTAVDGPTIHSFPSLIPPRIDRPPTPSIFS